MIRVGLHYASLPPRMRWECAGLCRPGPDGASRPKDAERRNCHGVTNQAFRTPVAGRPSDFDGGSVANRCPNAYIKAEATSLIHAWALAQRGNALPMEGGLYDQDHRTMQAFRILDNENQRISSSLVERERSKAGR